MSFDKNYFTSLIAGAQVSESTRYFEAGVYHVQIDNCKVKMSRQNLPRAIVECSVLGSNNPNFPASSQVSYIVKLENDAGPRDIKTFIRNIMNCSADQVTQDVINRVFIADGETQVSMAQGMQAIVNAYDKPTKAGGSFTKLDWRYVDPQNPVLPNFREMVSVNSNTQEVSPSEFDNSNQNNGASIPF